MLKMQAIVSILSSTAKKIFLFKDLNKIIDLKILFAIKKYCIWKKFIKAEKTSSEIYGTPVKKTKA